MTENTSVKLGEKSFSITGPLTLQQLIDVRVIVLDKPPQIGGSGALSGEDLGKVISHKALVVATGIDDPEVTPEAVLAMHCTEAELQDAYTKILHLAGLKLVDKEAPAPGEAKPAA